MKSPLSYRLCSIALSLALVGALGAGCQSQYVDPPKKTVFGDTGEVKANISGAVWDPEAYWYVFAMCGQDCPLPPLVFPGIPFFDGSVVKGAVVNLFDPVANQPVASAPPTAENGLWYLTGIASRPNPPFFTFTVHVPEALAGGTALVKQPPLALVPAANYLPTLSARPIFTRYTNCSGQSADIISDSGILDAVAKHEGRPAAGALLDPTLYGGVAVWWMYMPESPPVRVPAFGTKMSASAGRVLNIDWAPPGALPPEMKQSPRGFFVTNAPVSPIGLTVTLLDPIPPGPPTVVTFTAEDPVEEGPRPWQFPPVPPMPVVPGMVTFSQLPGIQPGAPSTPPDWVCLY